MWNRDQSSAIPYVILFTGLPAAGKTTLGHRVAAALNIPALGLDSIKESLFDSIGYSTPAWSKFLTLVSRDMAFRLLPNIGPCVFDIFISPEEARWRLLPAVETVIEIHLNVAYEIAWQRFVDRARSGRRHPGHLDADVTFDFFVSSLEPQHVDKPFRLGGPLLEIDTTDFGDPTKPCLWAESEVVRLLHCDPSAYRRSAMERPGADA
jgi:hypothetical protein